MKIAKDNEQVEVRSGQKTADDLKEIDEIREDLKQKIIDDDDDNPYTNDKLADLSEPMNESLHESQIKQEIDKLNKEHDELVQAELDKIYDKKLIYILFIVVFLANVLINIDHGTLPACFEQLMKKLDMNHFKYGILGSFVFGGLMVGSVVSTALYSKGEYIKKTLIVSMVLLIVCLVGFTLSTSYGLSLFLRFATGFFQIFLVAYQPVWSDTFCSEKFKSIALTINMLAAPLGIVGGYMLTYYMNKHLSWEWSFYCQSFGIIPCIIILVLIPTKYLNVEDTLNIRKQIHDDVANYILSRFDKVSVKVSNSSIEADQEKHNDNDLKFQQPEEETLTRDQQIKKALIEIQEEKKQARQGFHQNKEGPFGHMIKDMLMNPIYCGLVLCISGLYFIVTGIQYWVTQYMIDVLGATAELAMIYFVVLCFTGPIIGCIVGGLATAWVGGYNSSKGQILQCFGGICAVALGFPIPFCNDIHYMAIFLWFLLFFGGFIQPQILGIMLNSVQENKKISANSLAQIAFNLIGYLPAPTFYGFVAQIVKDKTSKIPMACLIYTDIIAVSALVLAILRKLQKEGQQRELHRRSASVAAKMKLDQDANDDKESQDSSTCPSESREIAEDQEQRLMLSPQSKLQHVVSDSDNENGVGN